MKALVAILTLALIAGCARVEQPKIPRYSTMPEDEALRVINQRDLSVARVQAKVDVTLIKTADKSVTLDGAFMIDRPAQLRLRLWKFGQAVIDLTARDGEAWLWIGREEAAGARRLTSKLFLDWSQLLLNAADPRYVRQMSRDGGTLKLQVERDGTRYACHYDAQTLALRNVYFASEKPKSTSIAFSDYRQVGDHIWPGSVVVSSGEGTIQLEFKDIEINGDLPATAFKPPARAEKLK